MSDLASVANYANRPDLRPVDKAVLLYFMASLDVWSYTPHKYETIATAVGIKARTVGRSVDALVLTGIVSRGADDPDAPDYAKGERPYWYRLLLNPRCVVPVRRSDERVRLVPARYRPLV